MNGKGQQTMGTVDHRFFRDYSWVIAVKGEKPQTRHEMDIHMDASTLAITLPNIILPVPQKLFAPLTLSLSWLINC